MTAPARVLTPVTRLRIGDVFHHARTVASSDCYTVRGVTEHANGAVAVRVSGVKASGEGFEATVMYMRTECVEVVEEER